MKTPEYLPRKLLKKNLYSEAEIDLLNELETLFRDWYSYFRKNQNMDGVLITSKGIDYDVDDMSFDGFYPHYLKQKKRILFIGRENRDLCGANYIDNLYQAIKNNNIGGGSVKSSAFHKRMLYVTYAILYNEFEWDNIPDAIPGELLDDFGTTNLSYAFMNLSKIGNADNKNNASANWELINESVRLSVAEHNYIQKEILLLNPNFIITMGLGDDILTKLGKIITSDRSDESVSKYSIKMHNKKFNVYDTWHFSKPMSDIRDLLKPLQKCLKRDKII